jgi:carbon-monoxide dehydrogenase medium subunit
MKDYFRPKEYHFPRDIGEAIGILSSFGDKAKIIAGGTDLLVQRPTEVECLVDISKLGLDYIKKGKDGFCIGATTLVNSLYYSPMFILEPYRVLSEAAGSLATATIRNMATVGGNLCNASPGGDLSLALMVLDAALIAVGPKGKREIPIKNLFRGVNLTSLDKKELLTEIRISPSAENAVGCFMKLRHHQTAIDIAVVNVATLLICKNGVCEKARIAMGSVAPTPIYASNAENLLAGEELREEIIQRAAEVASEESRPRLTSFRASPEYKRKMVSVLTKRALESSWRRSRLWQK